MKNNYSSSHPRVVVISGASREDAVYSKEILRAGASDFVEKPTMANFAEKSEEIRAKVKLSLFSDSPIKGTVDEFSGEEKSFITYRLNLEHSYSLTRLLDS